ncbi:disabled homolog 2-interacting protein isoform X1 [Lates japonicus]|uniref:Disabled homolog 2-interacting protein isoform X1 n=1 Tax=Lates japonicus TaxID=270547 RepID=A0AAD3NEB2_LATJO|nr:disabled homolog 2-interacting protein isoform X1 [Lates japonicus]
MAGVIRKGSGRPSYYYRFLGKSRLQRQRSRSRSRTRPSASKGMLPKPFGYSSAELIGWSPNDLSPFLLTQIAT